MAPDTTTEQAVMHCTRTAVESAIQNRSPLADFDEYVAVEVATEAVLSDEETDGSKYVQDTLADGGQTETRAERALTDVVAVEELAPGLARVVTWSDAHDVDMRNGGCHCEDKQYNIDGGMHCKHEFGAMLFARNDIPGVSMDDDLGGQTLVADGGQVMADDDHPADKFKVVDHDNADNVHLADTKAEAEEKKETAEEFGSDDVEILPPAGDTDPDVEVIDYADETTTEPDHVVKADAAPDTDHAPEALSQEEVEQYATDLDDRDVGEDPLKWMPGEFIDTIDGSQAINRKGFEVLRFFYDVDLDMNMEVDPDTNDMTHCRFSATATTPDGKELEAWGTSHVDRGDDPWLLVEMAATRARKRAISIATGAGACAVEELRNEPEGRQ